MRHRIFAVILTLAVASWAQTATQSPTLAPAKKSNCSCCDHPASAEAKSAGMSSKCSKDAQGKAPCSRGKAGTSCCQDANCNMEGAKDASRSKHGGGNGVKDKMASACSNTNCKDGCCFKARAAHASMSCCRHENQS